ncbi:MAG: hypothetical protein ABSF59_01220 [Candidatus Sulfotelmatobacter sp.]
MISITLLAYVLIRIVEGQFRYQPGAGREHGTGKLFFLFAELATGPYLWHTWDTNRYEAGLHSHHGRHTRSALPEAQSAGRCERELGARLVLAGVQSVLLQARRPRPKRVQFPLIASSGPKVDLTNEQMYEHVEFP